MGDLIRAEFARAKPRKNKKQCQNWIFLGLLVMFTTVIVICLWWTENLLSGALLFIVAAIVIVVTVKAAMMWSERHSPDWDHQ